MIGKYFTYEEMTATGTRAINRPDQQQLVNLTRLVALILDPLRHEAGPITVNSGFRSEIVNRNVGGSKGSYHMKGCAADIRHGDIDIIELADLIDYMGLPYDKVILEYGQNSEWLHAQMAPPGEDNRLERWIGQYTDGKMSYEQVV